MASSDINKKVAYGIARHLQSQVAAGVLNEEEKEGVDSKSSLLGDVYPVAME